jgi:hypothetical protein
VEGGDTRQGVTSSVNVTGLFVHPQMHTQLTLSYLHGADTDLVYQLPEDVAIAIYDYVCCICVG